MKRIYHTIIAVLLALFIAAAGSPQKALAAPQGNQGLQYGWVIDDTGNLLFTNEIAQKIAQSGAGWVRLNFRLGGFQTWTETRFNTTAIALYSQAVENARANNLKVLGLLSNESWHGMEGRQANNAEVAGGNGDNAYLQAFAQNAAVLLATEFAGRVDWWEVWNEPNAPLTYLYPSNFAWLLNHVYTGAKAANLTNARFISGGIASMQDSRGRITAESSGANYISATYSMGKSKANWNSIKTQYGSYPLDGIGQHIYVDGYKKTSSQNINNVTQQVRNAYVNGEGGSTTKKTFVTEFGWASNHVNEQTQASNLQVAYTQFKKTSYIQTAYWFFLRDEPAANLYFGLLRTNSSEKPAWNSYRTYANY